MPEDIISPEAEFLSKVHKYTSDAEELIGLYTMTHHLLGDHPEFPEESKVLTVKTIETLTALKLLTTMLVERELEVNDAVRTIVSDLEARLKKD